MCCCGCARRPWRSSRRRSRDASPTQPSGGFFVRQRAWPLFYRLGLALRYSPPDLQQGDEHERPEKAHEDDEGDERVAIAPVVPVSDKNPYAGQRGAKTYPKCGDGVPQPDCMSVLHRGGYCVPRVANQRRRDVGPRGAGRRGAMRQPSLISTGGGFSLSASEILSTKIQAKAHKNERRDEAHAAKYCNSSDRFNFEVDARCAAECLSENSHLRPPIRFALHLAGRAA